MKKTFIITLYTIGLLTLATTLVSAQDAPEQAMYAKRVWRKLDLREKQNRSWTSGQHHLVKLLFEAMQHPDASRALTAYQDDSLNKKLSQAAFKQRLKMPSELKLSPEDSALLVATGDTAMLAMYAPSYYQYRDCYTLGIQEWVYFDHLESRWKYQIESITVFIPADHKDNEQNSYDVEVATFRFAEVQEKVFKDNPQALWVNAFNDKEHRNMADAFTLRLFSSYLFKVSNPSNEALAEIYGSRQKGRLASDWAASGFLEFESGLWEY
jgi:gliding motility associated protien GldN